MFCIIGGMANAQMIQYARIRCVGWSFAKEDPRRPAQWRRFGDAYLLQANSVDIWDKCLGAIPGVGVYYGIRRIRHAIYFNPADKVGHIVRGVMEICGLGLLWLLVDLVATLYFGPRRQENIHEDDVAKSLIDLLRRLGGSAHPKFGALGIALLCCLNRNAHMTGDLAKRVEEGTCPLTWEDIEYVQKEVINKWGEGEGYKFKGRHEDLCRSLANALFPAKIKKASEQHEPFSEILLGSALQKEKIQNLAFQRTKEFIKNYLKPKLEDVLHLGVVVLKDLALFTIGELHQHFTDAGDLESLQQHFEDVKDEVPSYIGWKLDLAVRLKRENATLPSLEEGLAQPGERVPGLATSLLTEILSEPPYLCRDDVLKKQSKCRQALHALGTLCDKDNTILQKQSRDVLKFFVGIASTLQQLNPGSFAWVQLASRLDEALASQSR